MCDKIERVITEKNKQAMFLTNKRKGIKQNINNPESSTWKKRAKDMKRKLTPEEMQLISGFWPPKQRECGSAV